MKRTPPVFSFVSEQSSFMSAMVALMTFLAVLALGVSISIGSAVVKWNSHWENFATVQVFGGDANDISKKIESQKYLFKSARKVSDAEIEQMLRPWLKDGPALAEFVPVMYEIEFKSDNGMQKMRESVLQIPGAKFLPHTDSIRSSTNAGIKIMLISGFILLLVLGAVGICISYITRNIALIHKRELSILNQIGAHDEFVAKQLMSIIAKICMIASTAGFVAAAPILLFISSMANSTKVGLISQLSVPGFGWILLAMIPVIITISSIFIVRKTTFKILGSR